MKNDSCQYRYGCDDYKYNHCDGCNLAKVKTNADLFKQTFGMYATELWSMKEADFLKWLNEEVRK